MGQDQSKQSLTERPLSMRPSIKPHRPVARKLGPETLIIISGSQSLSLNIPEDTLTCGWLLSETIRLCGEAGFHNHEHIIALRSDKSEALDCWLLLYERHLLPFKTNDKIFPFFVEPVSQTVDASHFIPLKIIGKGGFSYVIAVRKKDTGALYAIKTMEKGFIIAEDKIEQIRTEKEILARIKHPFIVSIYWAFQSKSRLHLVLELCPGGELFYHLHNLGRFTEDQAKFYFAEVVLALEYLHSLDIIYRDLKPENIILDIDGHIRITDFGLSKQYIGPRGRSYSICGSPEYMAPEMLTSGEHGRTVDFYTLGALLYEMLTGLPPYYDKNRSKMRWKILNDELEIPSFVSKHAKEILAALLTKNPDARLGTGGVDDIKNHGFCKNINWEKFLNREVKPPLRPHIRSSNFDPEYKSLKIEQEKEVEAGNFEGFEYCYDEREEVNVYNDRSSYSDVTNTTTVSMNNSRAGNMEESKKNRSAVWSTEHSRADEVSAKIRKKSKRKIAEYE